jgi:hypothetical protein
MDFRKSLLALVDSTSRRAASMIGDFNDTIQTLDWDNQMSYLRERRRELIERGNELLSDLSDYMKQVKESIKDFSVTVPCDTKNGEKLEYSIDGDTLTIEVKFEDEHTSKHNKMSVRIPKNSDVKNVKATFDKEACTATISIPKILQETEESVEDKDEAELFEEKPKTTRKYKKRKTSKLEERLDENIRKVAPKRKYVRKTVNETAKA